MLRHPCILRELPTKGSKVKRGPRQTGTKSEVATSPLPLRGPKESKNATSPLRSPGSPTKGSKIRSGPQQRGTKSEVASSPLPSRGPKRGRKCYVTPAFSGIPNKGEQNQKWSPTNGNKIRSGYITPAFSGVQRRAEMLRHPCVLQDPQQRGAKSGVVPNIGEQNREWLLHPYRGRGPKEGGNATSPWPSRGSRNTGSTRALTGLREKYPSRGS